MYTPYAGMRVVCINPECYYATVFPLMTPLILHAEYTVSEAIPDISVFEPKFISIPGVRLLGMGLCVFGLHRFKPIFEPDIQEHA